MECLWFLAARGAAIFDKNLKIAAPRAAATISRLPYIYYQDSCPPGSKTSRLGFIELIFNCINSKLTLPNKAKQQNYAKGGSTLNFDVYSFMSLPQCQCQLVAHRGRRDVVQRE